MIQISVDSPPSSGLRRVWARPIRLTSSGRFEFQCLTCHAGFWFFPRELDELGVPKWSGCPACVGWRKPVPSIDMLITIQLKIEDDADARARVQLEAEINALIDSDPDYRRIAPSRRVVEVGGSTNHA